MCCSTVEVNVINSIFSGLSGSLTRIPSHIISSSFPYELGFPNHIDGLGFPNHIDPVPVVPYSKGFHNLYCLFDFVLCVISALLRAYCL